VRRRAAALAGLLALSLAAAGCGGDDDDSSGSADGGTPATEWADSVCSSVADWTSTVRALPETLRSNLSAEGVDEAATELEDATDELIDSLRDAGRPDTESGDAVRNELNQLADDLRVQLDSLTSTLEAADTPAEWPQALVEATSALAAMGSSLTSALGELREADVSGELEEAFREADPCNELTGTTTG
jgi:hypothetical protein